ncbi:MAG: hypothetical protein NVV72_11285 [Asticcacaulis sp.]|nr:hypothetical protein [Asticcacaulis sp.]
MRDTAICTIIAAKGATIIATSTPRMPAWLFLRLPPRKKAKLPSMEMAPAMVAVIVMISVSWFFTWASSWAITPATSSCVRRRSRPVVAATAACCGLRPVAKAFGWGSSMM